MDYQLSPIHIFPKPNSMRLQRYHQIPKDQKQGIHTVLILLPFIYFRYQNIHMLHSRLSSFVKLFEDNLFFQAESSKFLEYIDLFLSTYYCTNYLCKIYPCQAGKRQKNHRYSFWSNCLCIQNIFSRFSKLTARKSRFLRRTKRQSSSGSSKVY